MTPEALREFHERRLIAAIRAESAAQAVRSAEAVARGGVALVEITFTVPDAPRAMRELAGREGVIVGAGTVLTPADAERALEAGARFIIAPNLSQEVARVALQAGVFYCPGAYTTNEIVAARDAGAHVIKVYPVGVAGGPAYIKVVREPLPNVPMMASGGTTLVNMAAFLEAGCLGIGLGAALADSRLVAAGQFDEITRRARAFVDRIRDVTEGKAAAGQSA